MCRLLIAMLLAAAVLLAPAAMPAPALTVGMSDQQAESWGDLRLRALGLRHARLVAPWNAATSEPARVRAWLDAVTAAGHVPHVAFEHLRSDRCPGSPCVLPSRAEYGQAVRALRAAFPQVTTFTAWNEANHRSQPTVQRPDAVAGYYEELTAICPSCTVVAGDVLDSGGYVRWLERFQQATTSNPRLWGLHNYGDVTYGRTSGTDAVLGTVPGELWVEETGGIVRLGRGLSYDETRASASVDRAFAIALARPRITRMYVFHWKGTTAAHFDSGLVRPDGALRPSYDAMVRGVVRAAAATAPVSTALRWSAAWSGSRLVLRATCPVAACRGSVTATLRTKAKGRRAQTRRLAVRTYRTTASARSQRLRIVVARTVRRSARRAASRSLKLTVTPTVPTGRRTVVSVAVKRPR